MKHTKVMRKAIIAFVMIHFCCFSYAQLSTNELPVGYNLDLNLAKAIRSGVSFIKTPVLDMATIEKEDLEDEEYDMPPRFGYSHKVNYDISNSGTWRELPNGDKLWQLGIVCPNALSVNILYDKFWIPEGGKLFIYSADKQHSIGAFTSRNNKGDSVKIRGFASGLVYSDSIVLEYYQPKEVTTDAIVSIDYIVHGYRYIGLGNRDYGGSASCMVNVNCPEGQDWQNEKKAVAVMLVNGDRICTGTLLNTTSFDQKPYFLTANHCFLGEHDAEDHPDLDNYSFYWNYESPGCLNPSIEPIPFSTSGATILANNYISDFGLLRLTEDPKDISGYTPYYAGWDHSGNSGNPGVCIHHPKGDLKKISTVYSTPLSTDYYTNNENINGLMWKVNWTNTNNGYSIVENGSSGAALFNSNHRVIGQLHGGNSTCTNEDNEWFGKFNVSWTGNGNSNVHRRLDCWLDSINTGASTVKGYMMVSDSITLTDSIACMNNYCIVDGGVMTVSDEIMMEEGNKIVVESGGTFIIDGTNDGMLTEDHLILKSGATVKIINGGIIETMHDFYIPLGVKLFIENGKIY